MIQVELQDAKRSIQNYTCGSSPFPYFISADGGREYSSITTEYQSFEKLRVSDYCRDDSFPDIDRLLNDVQGLTGDTILLGIGESISLGCSSSLLTRLVDLSLSHKLIVLCRGARELIRRQNIVDRKFNSRRYSIIRSSLDCNVVHIADEVPCPAVNGFRSIIRELEDGRIGDIWVKSSLPLQNVRRLSSCYELLVEEGKIGPGLENRLSEQNWREYLADSSSDNEDVMHWRSYLRMLIDGTRSSYMTLVMRYSSNYDEYTKELYRAILQVSVDDPEFGALYAERKSILKDTGEPEMADFVAVAASKGVDRIHYLTDLTSRERFAVVEDIVNAQTVPNDLNRVYPALARYLSKYEFNCNNGALYTDYFDRYKWCKILNKVDSSHLDTVMELATDGSRPYNMLSARNAVVESLAHDGVKLYWVDALGVEFLAFIQALAEERGLSMTTYVTRATLPSLTSFNKGFFEEWNSAQRCSIKQLDKLIHEGEGDFDYRSEKIPTHIVKELEIVEKTLSHIAADLLGRKVRRVVLTSDHGASRLAVINEHENRWEMQVKGQHSGRCCPVSDLDTRPDCAIEGNGYWSLANYDRFRGGRKASVEVHGGATLEEVVVPVIEFALRDESIEIVSKTEVAYTSFKARPEVEFFCASPLRGVTVRIAGKIYQAVDQGGGHFKATLTDVNRPGEYTADVYAGDNRIGQLNFVVRSQAAQSNDDDWFI